MADSPGAIYVAPVLKNIISRLSFLEKEDWPGTILLQISGLLAVGVFFLDLNMRSGVVIGALYMAPVLITVWLPRKRHTLIMANVCTLLTVVALILSRHPGDWRIEATNRIVSLFVIWATTIVTLLRRRAEEKLLAARGDLEVQMGKRAVELTRANDDLKKEISERQRAEDSLRQLSGHLLHLQDEERRRIARELHDTTGQSLAAIAVNLAQLEKRAPKLDSKGNDLLADSIALAEQCSRELRTLSYLLHPPLLEEAGLASALRWYADGVTQRSGIKVDVDVPDELHRLPPDLETTLFRIVQESLTNISRHSGSKTARIKIFQNTGEVLLEIKDQGRGIPPEKLARVNGNVSGLGVGIAGIWERIRQFQGELDINSSSRGTTVSVVLPVPEETT